MTDKLQRPGPLRVFDANVPISGPLEGGFADWPSHIKEAVIEAKEACERANMVHLTLQVSYCEPSFDGWVARIRLIENRDQGIRLPNGELLRWRDLRG